MTVRQMVWVRSSIRSRWGSIPPNSTLARLRF